MRWKHWSVQESAGSKRLASLLATVAVALAGVATSLPASAQLGGALSTGVSATKHNMGSGGPGTIKVGGTGATTEVCVFCHTPHAAVVANGPLWNRTAGSATYAPYTSATLTGGTYASGLGTAQTPGAISLACLSCHDGTQAMNSVINQPGSGFGTGSMPGIWGGAADGKMIGIAAVGGGTEGLSNDHPIGVRYAGGSLVAAQANNGYTQWSTDTINGVQAFWVEAASATTTGTGRQKADMWLYNRGTATTANNEAFVECASCHDPHTSNTTFLRTKNDFSSVCLSCHIK